MKRILITGKNSYVGVSLIKWLGKKTKEYSIDSISLRNETWKEIDFSGYDVLVHLAGIAHIKETKENANLYYEVNRDLAYEVALKAKKDGVKQFILLSTMSVYGIETGIIDRNSPLKPKSNYGKSKLEAEKLITKLSGSFFKIVILRPPMIYGNGCKGNYVKLTNIAQKSPLFPKIYNQRSMIYIDNLSELIKIIIDNSIKGIYHPQNIEYVCTSDMVELIAELHGSKLRMTKLFNVFFKVIRINTVKKVFGNLVYDKKIDDYKNSYTVYDFKKSIELTERIK